jgi:hypothetical protein
MQSKRRSSSCSAFQFPETWERTFLACSTAKLAGKMPALPGSIHASLSASSLVTLTLTCTVTSRWSFTGT